jgi:hypothetical protein
MREVINADKIVIGKTRWEESTWKTGSGWESDVTVVSEKQDMRETRIVLGRDNVQ